MNVRINQNLIDHTVKDDEFTIIGDVNTQNRQVTANGSDSGHNSPGHLTDDDETGSADVRNGSEPKINAGHYLHAPAPRPTGEDAEEHKLLPDIPSFRKPYLGGYRNKLTGTIYHHASAQTNQNESLPPISIPKISRQTQSAVVQHRSQQTPSSKCCQTDRPGIYLSTRKDTIIVPQLYETASQSFTRTLSQVIKIQTVWRSYKARKTALRMLEEKNQSLTEKESKKRLLDVTSQEHFPRTLLNETIRTKQDFERIYQSLDDWKKHRLASIASSETDSPVKQSAVLDIVKKEAQALALLDNHRKSANEDRRERSIYKMLKQMAMPKLWRGTNGQTFKVVTPFVSKMRSLRQLYYDLEKAVQQGHSMSEQRLDVLVQLQEYIKQEDNDADDGEPKLRNEISCLIEREIELLARRASPFTLSTLRQRIKFLLLQYICLTYFRENGMLQPQEYLLTESDCRTLNRCPSCRHYSPMKDFLSSSAAVQLATKCRACRALDSKARGQREYGLYRRQLRWIRGEELRQTGAVNGIAFVLQEPDVQYLMDKIWHRKSALSEVDDPEELVLCRWNSHEEWSPGNCVLLTANEAEVHKNMATVENYGTIFVQKVRHKHALARRHFRRLPPVATWTPKLPNGLMPMLTTSMYISVKPVKTDQLQAVQ